MALEIEKNLENFQEFFERDLEKGFSADIACCGQCYDDFLSVWPLLAYAAENSIDETAIDLQVFYLGSYLRDVFTEDEFYEFVCQLPCPRCGKLLGNRIWLYNFPFNVPEGFENNLKQVSIIAQRTPFLLLESKFCQDVLLAIRELSASVSASRVDRPLFRGRSTANGVISSEMNEFDLPPADKVSEGRYNHAGNPVLYLSSDACTCWSELREQSCKVVEFRIDRPIKILDLLNPFCNHEIHADLLNSLVYSALVSAKQGYTGLLRPHYIFSRFVSDCAVSAGFDAIKYPSTRSDGKRFNLALINSELTLAKTATIIQYIDLDAA